MRLENADSKPEHHINPFRRIVVLADSGSRWLTAATAVTLAVSPHLSAISTEWRNSCGNIVIASGLDVPQIIPSRVCTPTPEGVLNPLFSPLSVLCRDVAGGDKIMNRMLFTVDAKSGMKGKNFVPDIEEDVFVYVSGWGDKRDSAHLALRPLSRMSCGSGDVTAKSSGVKRSAGRLIILADESTCQSACDAARKLSGWCVLLCIVPAFAPPANNHQLAAAYVRECDVMCGPLECAALGVALGTVKNFAFNFKDPVRVVTLDIAIGIGLTVLVNVLGKGTPAASAGVTIYHIDPKDGGSLVWGMFAQYLMDYYGRAMMDAVKTSPLRWLLDSSPRLRLNATVSDWVNFGISTMMPFQGYYRSAAEHRRKQLQAYHHNFSTTRAAVEVLNNVDMCLRDMTRPRQQLNLIAQQGDGKPNECSVGQADWCPGPLCRMVEHDVALRPLYPPISPNSVTWDMYVKTIARAALERVVSQLAGQAAKAQVPQPQPLYHNDIIFHGPRRAPRNSLFTRFFPDDVRWLMRSGLQSNGEQAEAAPGLTEESMEAILRRPGVVRIIAETAKAESKTEEDVKKQAAAILRNVGDNLNQLNLRLFGLLVRRVLFQLYSEVTLNDAAFERLHAATCMPQTYVMLLPAHRSYMDFIIMTYLLLVMGLPLPHVCAGEDFLRMGHITKFLRGGGAFFIRRTFRNDPLYYVLFKEYIHSLVIRRQMIEFFIEGTRSRTGKAQRPMLGLLKCALSASLDAQEVVDDVCILPISISYDELLEAKLYATEQLGLSKPKETFGNLLRASTLLKRRHGKIHVYVGEPFSLKSFRNDPHQCPAGFEPKQNCVRSIPQGNVSNGSEDSHVQQGTFLRLLTNLAWHVVHKIQQNTVITPTALLSTVVHAFSTAAEGISLKEAQTHVLWLRDYIIKRDARLSEDCARSNGEELCRIALFHLAEFVEVRVVGGEKWLAICPEREAPLGLAICSNQLIHILVDEAIVAVTAQCVGELSHDTNTIHVQTNMLESECEPLRSLLAGEFQDYISWCPYTYATWFKHALKRLLIHDNGRAVDCVVVSEGSSAATNSQVHKTESITIRSSKQLQLLTNTIRPFLESLYVVSLAVSAVAGAGVDNVLRRKPLLAACQTCALQLRDEKRFELHLQSCGSVTLKNAFVGIVEFANLKQLPSEGDGVYAFPTAAPPSLPSAWVEPIVRRLGKLLSPLFKTLEIQEIEKDAQLQILNAYTQSRAEQKQACKM